MAYLTFLDGLRAIAVCAVVWYHLDPRWIANGYLGVDVFFVISGFIVSYATANRPSASFGEFLSSFYASRILRIVPALLVCLLASGLASFLFIPDAWLSASQYSTARAAFWGFSNIQLARGSDYFSPVTEFNPFTHTWSLGVEQQFYLVFPLLLFPWLRSRAGKLFCLALFAGLAIASCWLWLSYRPGDPLRAFYLIQFRFWELAAGALCFQASVVLKRHGSLQRGVLSLPALLVLVAALFVPLPQTLGWIANLAAVAATGTLILALQRDERPTGSASLLAAAVPRFIGRISYSLYLWHWPVFVLARWTFGLETSLQRASALCLAIGLAIASYALVETPFRRSRMLRRMPGVAIVAMGLLATAGSWTIFNLLARQRPAISLSTVMQNRALWMADAPLATFPDLPGCAIAESRQGLIQDFGRTGCGVAEPAAGRLFVMGDSHAGVYLHLVKRFTLVTGIGSTLVTSAGCPLFSLQWQRDTQPSCMTAVREGLDALAARAQAGDVLFLPSLRLPRFSDQFARVPDSEATAAAFGTAQASERARAVEQAIALLRPLTDRGVRILFEAPKPLFRAPTFRCSDWFNRTNPACADGLSIEKAFVLKLRQPVLDGFAVIADRLPGVTVWDPLPVLCPGETCRAVEGGKPLFADGDHVSAHANVLLTPSFVAKMRALLARP